jgi:DNA-binding NarL/FixJ family response regulator
MKIVVVEDSPVIRKHLIAALLAIPDVIIAGEAESEQVALELIPRVLPDVVILDLSLSPGSGFNVLRGLKNIGNTAEVFVLTNQTHDQYRQLSEELGAAGFYDKTIGVEQILERIKSMAGV